MSYDFTYMCNLKTKTNKQVEQKQTRRENILTVAKWEEEYG